MRGTYWNNTKVANLIRGVAKPKYVAFEDLDEWEAEAKQRHPIRFWVAETGLIKLQNILCVPYDFVNSLKYYLKNRWVTKTHTLTSNLQRGKYQDLDNRILHCLFDELVNFVERDLAYLQRWHNKTYNFVNGRCKQAGIDHLTCDCELRDEENVLTPQALRAKEILFLYNWWTATRPKREDPYKITKIYDCEILNILSQPETDNLNSLQVAEKHYQEDTDMLVRLIKVRESLLI